jgi:putative ABC transport system permease protein
MKWKNLMKVAFKSILKNRMRSILTMLGIIIGVGAVITLVAVGQGASAAIQSDISALGTNLIMVMPGSSRMGGVSRGAASMNTLTLKDTEVLAEKATLLQNVSPLIRASGQVVAAGKNWSSSVNGVAENYLQIKDWKLEEGSFFSDRDIRSRKKVAVLGNTVAEELYGDQSPLGQKIRIRNIPFTVIGVLEEKGQSMMGDQDDVILAPSTTVLYRMTDGKNIHMIMASAISIEEMDAAQEEMIQILRKQHKLKDGDNDDFGIRSQTEIVERASSVTGTLTMLLGAIAGVSLLVGGIGIMNIMLVSVTERTREIGIRLAIGARAGDVLVQFLIEAILLSMMGGFIGIVLGVGLGKLLSSLLNMMVVFNPVIILVSFFFSGAVGVFFGFYPAKMASKLNPIDALHYE